MGQILQMCWRCKGLELNCCRAGYSLERPMAPSTHGSIESIVLNNNHCELLQFILDQHKPKSESDRDCNSASWSRWAQHPRSTSENHGRASKPSWASKCYGSYLGHVSNNSLRNSCMAANEPSQAKLWCAQAGLD